MRFGLLLLGSLHAFSHFPCASSAQSNVSCTQHAQDLRNWIFVLTDIGNEPDDSISLVRLLVHADLYKVEGLVAATSFWLRNITLPRMTHDILYAYGPVQDKLQLHSNVSFPMVGYLKSKVASGPTVYGMRA
jgi:hypothetical protein